MRNIVRTKKIRREFSLQGCYLNIIISLLFLAFLTSCGSNAGTGRSTSSVSITIGTPGTNGAAGLNKAAIPSSLDNGRIIFTISGNDMSTITKEVLLSGQTAITETFDVPKGDNRSFKVEALDSSGNILYNGEKTGVKLDGNPITLDITMEYALPSVPSAPTGVSASAGDTQNTVTWSAVTGATSYNIYWTTTAGVTTSNGTKITGATSPYTHTGLTNGTTYYYIVTAVNAGGESVASSQVSATPLLPGPSAPIGVSATAGNAQVSLTWTAVSGATSYKVYRSTTSGTQGTLLGTSTSAAYTDSTAANGATYYYTITAVNAWGESVDSAEVSARPALPVYTVTPSAGTGGTISPSTPQYINSGVTTSFTITASSGYIISSVTGCGGTLSGSTYTTGAITADCTITATFTYACTVITNVTELQNMNNNLSGCYELGNDIDASATATWNSNGSGGYYGFVPVGSAAAMFTGAFDGLGHTITGLTINRPATDYIGLFGYTNGAIRNIGLVGGSVTGKSYVGGLAGSNNYGSITNSYNTGNVTAGSTSAGGGTYYSDVGGLVGYNNSGTISNSFATGSVSGTGNGVGGLVGVNSNDLSIASITNSYSTGSVTGFDYVGGLVGGNSWGTITNSYSTGSVTGNIYDNRVGGLVGSNLFGAGPITSSYWDTQTSGWATSNGGTGKTTAEMMAQANFIGWDFTNTWWMSEGNTRPFLRMEYSTTITSAHQLQLMALNLGANYTLGADINMAELSQASGLWNTTTGFVPVGDNTTKFTGVFDGRGHTITGLTINRSATNYVGLFGYANGATISNIGLAGGSVSGQFFVGGLVGRNYGTISNSYNTGSVSGNYVGGLVGDNAGTITDSYSTGTVSGTNYVGGLVGYNFGGTITNSYSTGTVTGSSYVGGLVGYNYGGTITNSYSTGAVIGSGLYVGGLVGENAGTITSSYWDTQTSGTSTGIGVGTLTGATGLTTSQMKAQASFSGWDFTNTWSIIEGVSYPTLRVFWVP